jgi:hypothetical protein
MNARLGIAVAMAAVAGSCHVPPSDEVQVRLEAEPWPAMDELFRRDARWLGGDAVWSIELGPDRILWLFGDSFVATSAARLRRESVMVRNAIAIQRGLDPATATLAFAWQENGGKPSAFFAAPDATAWYWPGHGAMVDGELLLFRWRIGPFDGGLGFQGLGWDAVVVTNPDAEPAQWHVVPCAVSAELPRTMGCAVVVDATHVYAFATGLDRPEHMQLARWPRAAVRARDLSRPEWSVSGRGFVAEADLDSAGPSDVAAFGQTEFTVLPCPAVAPFLAVHTEGFGASTLAWQRSPRLDGGWSGAHTFWRPPECDRKGILVYAAKAHPMLARDGTDLVVSYSTNHSSFATLVDDPSLYFPRFLRCRWRISR